MRVRVQKNENPREMIQPVESVWWDGTKLRSGCRAGQQPT
ncbi:hypothetical protein COLO4_33446 [Corchorus olitorius]|uniref:Uncharacterized protein n=1 Tax=Corchorus olitorius TaxID=93759 RepID=A0A1R3GTP4_9ROSI|nr:hypothetical protein COLO4_33446 [Corchorus olitorius]